MGVDFFAGIGYTVGRDIDFLSVSLIWFGALETVNTVCGVSYFFVIFFNLFPSPLICVFSPFVWLTLSSASLARFLAANSWKVASKRR